MACCILLIEAVDRLTTAWRLRRAKSRRPAPETVSLVR